MHSLRTPLSESVIWQWQKAGYQNLGTKAWTEGGVPFYLTNHPKIAQKYAQIALMYLLENKNILNSSEPLIFLELGSGLGKLSFYLLQEISKWVTQGLLKDFSIKYIISDISEKNCQFWQNHKAFKPFIDQGILDFALFDPTQDDILLTLNNEQILLKNNPLIVFANYYFDSIPQDIYLVKDHRVYQGELDVEADTASENPLLEKELPYQLIFDQMICPPFEIERLMELIPNSSYITYPTAGFQTLENLKKICNSNILMLTGDKAQFNHKQMDWKKQPPITFHTTVSFTVNFELLKMRCLDQHGFVCLPQHFDELFSIALLQWGPSFSVASASKTYEDFDHWSLQNHNSMLDFLEKKEQPTLGELNLLLKFDSFDPFNFFFYNEKIKQALKHASFREKEDLIFAIQTAKKLFFATKKEEAILLVNMASLLLTLNQQLDAFVLLKEAAELNSEF
ncbi:MAG: hypothetical protein JHC93_00880 [Parachlamydiales bacterium]|nr:hypothetical protein [Parachlamydiales bacterium]